MTPDERVAAVLKGCPSYLFKHAASKSDADSALMLAKQARQLSGFQKYKQGEDEAGFWIELASHPDSALYPGTLRNGYDHFCSVGNANAAIRLFSCMARYYGGPGGVLYDDLPDLRNKFPGYQKKGAHRAIIAELDSCLLVGLSETGDDFLRQYNEKMAEKAYLRALELLPREGPNHWKPYTSLSTLYLHQGKLDRALDYALKTITLLESGAPGNRQEWPYYQVGRIYFEQGNIEQSIAYFLQSAEVMHNNGHYINGALCKSLVRSYLSLGKPREALAFLDKHTDPTAAYNNYDKQLIAESKGNCYLEEGRYDSAEAYYRESLGAAEKLRKVNILTAYYALAQFYVKTNQVEKARTYLDELERKDNADLVPFYVKPEIQQYLSRADSALGHYAQALRHLQQYTVMHDSIFNDTKNKQLEELKIRFETEKKDKDIQLLTKQSLLQTSQLQRERLQFQYENERKKHELKLMQYEEERKDQALRLKEQNILLLGKQDQLQKAELQKTRLLRDVFVGGAVMLLLLLGVIYSRYRQNRKTNRLLMEQQEVINRTNEELQLCNEQQFNLLIEKEWLVREIHHRVKNNLQIVISLLNAQSEHLDHPSALAAIQESRERMQAISIIHQKLYKIDSGALVNLRSYIYEMLENLKSGFVDTRRIEFKLSIADINLDTSQLVSLGLVLNEAITNAIKYAYEPHEKGSIWISAQFTGDGRIRLTIADQGKGLPPGMDVEKPDSLGLRLIRLFSQQLEGDLQFTNNNGLEITLTFAPTVPEHLEEFHNKIIPAYQTERVTA